MEVRLAVNGFGNVGQGLARLIADHGARYESDLGVALRLTGVADQRGAAVNAEGLNPQALLRAKAEHGTVAAAPGGKHGLAGVDFLDDAPAQVFVEAASTNYENAEPGWSYIRHALERDMDVVLASKGALALYWAELIRLAGQAGRRVLFSATVGSPLPSLEIAGRALVGAEITAFEGIVNGTSHQILTAMSQGASYDEGVRQAQEMGIAETDPTLDVDGWDAAAKATILANAIFGSRLRISDVAREGIRGVTTDDLAAASANGEAIKLIARASRTGDAVQASVSPERRPLREALGRLTGDDMGMVFHTHPFGTVSTAVEPEGESGGITTAMTVLRDVFNLARDRGWSSPASR